MEPRYIFGGNTGVTPEQIARKRAIAQRMMATGTPHNVPQGIYSLGSDVAGALAMRRAQNMEDQGIAGANQQFQDILGMQSPTMQDIAPGLGNPFNTRAQEAIYQSLMAPHMPLDKLQQQEFNLRNTAEARAAELARQNKIKFGWDEQDRSNKPPELYDVNDQDMHWNKEKGYYEPAPLAPQQVDPNTGKPPLKPLGKLTEDQSKKMNAYVNLTDSAARMVDDDLDLEMRSLRGSDVILDPRGGIAPSALRTERQKKAVTAGLAFINDYVLAKTGAQATDIEYKRFWASTMPTWLDPDEVVEDKRRTRQMMVEAIKSGMTEDMVAHAEAAIEEGRRKAEEQRINRGEEKITEADIEETARRHNTTVEKVKERLRKEGRYP